MKTKLKKRSNVMSMNELCLSMYMCFIQIGFVSTTLVVKKNNVTITVM